MKKHASAWCLWLLLVVTAFAQEGLDSTYYWFDRANIGTPSSQHPFTERLSDGNLLVLWYPSGLGAPYYTDAYASVYATDENGGQRVISDQLVLNHVAISGQAPIADPNGGFVLVETLWESDGPNTPVTSTLYYHHITVDYDYDAFQLDWTVTDEPFDSLAVSNGFQPVINGHNLLIAKSINNFPLRYYMQVLDLNSGQLLRQEPMTFFSQAIAGEISVVAIEAGFFWFTPGNIGSFSSDGELLWVRENDVQLQRARLVASDTTVYVVGCLADTSLVLLTMNRQNGQLVSQDTLWSNAAYQAHVSLLWQDDLLFVAATQVEQDNLLCLNASGEIISSTRIDSLGQLVDFIPPNLLWSRDDLLQYATLFDQTGQDFDTWQRVLLPGYDSSMGLYYQNQAIVYDGWNYCGASAMYNNNFWHISSWSLLMDRLDVQEPGYLPQDFALTCFPNPFNLQTALEFFLPQGGEAQLSVYNLLGQLIIAIPSRFYPAGLQQQLLDFAGKSSGVYIVELKTSRGSLTHAVTLVK